MAAAEEYRPTRCVDVLIFTRKFISDNATSSDLNLRWLAHALKTTVEILERVHDGDLTPDLSHRVREFRLSEIAAERAKREDEIEKLETEARKLHGAATVA